jgi:hypothetical protein
VWHRSWILYVNLPGANHGTGGIRFSAWKLGYLSLSLPNITSRI